MIDIKVKSSNSNYKSSSKVAVFLAKQLTQLLALDVQVQQIPHLEGQRQQLQNRKGRVAAAQQFATELRLLVEQIEPQQKQYLQQVQKAQKLLKSLSIDPSEQTQIADILEVGTSLNAQILQQLQTVFADLVDPTITETLQSQVEQLNTQLQTAQSAQKQWLTLPTKQQQQVDSRPRNGEIAARMRSHPSPPSQQEPQLQSQLTELETQLSALNDPPRSNSSPEPAASRRYQTRG